MREHLVFLLSAPLGSFGSYAGHERRGSGLFPMRSAMLGLIGAALGIERTDTDGQAALRSYSVAVQSFQRTMPLRDYHTVQAVPTARAKKPATRKSALERAGRNTTTIITTRDYRCDVLFGAALWGRGRWSLAQIADFLQRPAFTLYLGRKSCPLTSPVNPQIVKTESPVDALSSIEVPSWLRLPEWKEANRKKYPVYSDPVEGLEEPALSERAPGEPLDRISWTFAERTVWRLGGRDSELARGDS